jgi:hypothetical protein
MGLGVVEDLYRECYLGRPIPGSENVVQPRVLDLVMSLGPAVIPLGLQIAADPRPDQEYRRLFGLGILYRAGPAGLDSIAVLLDHKLPEVRHEAARMLAGNRSLEAARKLRPYVEDPQASVRMYALAGVADLPDSDLPDIFLKALNDPKSSPREWAVQALRSRYRPEMRVTIGRLARADYDNVRIAASETLLGQKEDHLARRLGRRYEKRIESEMSRLQRQGAWLVAAIVTGVCALFLVRPLFGTPTANLIGYASLLGFIWGGAFLGVSGAIEESVLLTWVPIGAAVGVALVSRSEGWRRGLRALLVGIAPFYGCFGVGWAWVWGYLGF